MKVRRTNINTEQLVLVGALTAVVIVLQVMALITGMVLPLAVNLVLVPIVIGASIGGVGIGAWLGFVSGLAILIADPSVVTFYNASIFGTIATVLLKGVASGLAAAVVYKLLEKKNKYLAVVCAAIACPIANTGVFVLGCLVFFMDLIRELGNGASVVTILLFGFIGINFIIELALNAVLSPVIYRLLKIKSKGNSET